MGAVAAGRPALVVDEGVPHARGHDGPEAAGRTREVPPVGEGALVPEPPDHLLAAAEARVLALGAELAIDG